MTPYYKPTANEIYPLYSIKSGESTSLTTNSFHVNEITYGYKNKNNEFVQIPTPTEYYDESGVDCYKFPNSASDLPQVLYNGETFYFDTLIKNGDSYQIDNHKFETMDIEEGDGKTTYGEALLSKIKLDIRIENFDTDVKNLPNYLTGGDFSEAYTIESIDYKITPNYFALFGELYIEKLSDWMILQAQNTISTLLKKGSKTIYKKIDFEKTIDTEGNLQGVITLSPS